MMKDVSDLINQFLSDIIKLFHYLLSIDYLYGL